MTNNDKTTIYTNELQNSLRIAAEKQHNNDYSIISFSVRSGRYYEKEQCFGFTHLLEHLIFSPNEKYPEVGFLQKYVEQRGGQVNAWTHSLTTNFHLQCPHEHFIDCVSILIDKIVNPLFTVEEITREINAIDAEFSLKKRDEQRRILSVQQTQTNPNHPFSRFTVGNRLTFCQVDVETLIQQLRKFHSTHFCADNIAVGITLPNNVFQDVLPKIESILTSHIRANASIDTPCLPSIIDKEAQGKLIFVEPVVRSQALILSFIVEKIGNDELDNLALTMLQQLLDSKQQYGLTDTLKRICDVEQLIVTGGLEDNTIEEIQIKMSVSKPQISDELIARIKFVTRQYLEFLQSTDIESWRFREKQKQLVLAQHFGKTQSMMDATIDMAERLNTVCANTDLSEALRLDDDLVKQRLNGLISTLSDLSPTTYVFTTLDIYSDCTDFYDVNYSISSPKPIELDDKYTFKLPEQNQYMPTSLRVFPFNPEDLSVEHWEEPGMKFKFMQFIENSKPLGDIYISISCQSMFGSAENVLVKKVWLEALQTKLSRTFYLSEFAGLYYRVYGHQHGICIHTSGFTEKQILLVLDLINLTTAFKFSQQEFERSKFLIKRKLNKNLLQKPVNRLISILTNRVHPNVLEPLILLDGIEKLSFKTATKHQQLYFSKTHIESLMVGNWTKKMAESVKQHLDSRMIIDTKWKKPKITANLIHKSIVTHATSTSTADNAFVLYQQIVMGENGNSAEKEVAIALMLECLLSPIFFVEMRNIRQLGYSVGVGYKPINQQAGLVFYTQAPNTSPDVIYHNVKEVIAEVIESFSELIENLAHVKYQVIQQVSETPRTASDFARYIWLHYEQVDPLEYTHKMQEAINKVSEEDILNVLESILDGANSQIRLMSHPMTHHVETEIKQTC
ncbi:insulinase family protein [Agaribacter marinus]|uniref:Peptidase M16 n=1 Tax=Agaribacter marinus TaxID=1431249 RepID=A0AA37WJB2_9ALTE|nr:insulinase family protein [Agaribacter marinus]GLR72033.1 peptidase M16 [Agaribacter marinus]